MLDNNDILKLSEVFATKEDLKDFVKKIDFDEFKNTSLSKLDEILDGVNLLKQEKIIKDAQDKRKTEVLKTHNEALKRGKILTNEEALKISQSGVF
jgi:uncharacterized protein YehS (DUF1456 family)